LRRLSLVPGQSEHGVLRNSVAPPYCSRRQATGQAPRSRCARGSRSAPRSGASEPLVVATDKAQLWRGPDLAGGSAVRSRRKINNRLRAAAFLRAIHCARNAHPTIQNRRFLSIDPFAGDDIDLPDEASGNWKRVLTLDDYAYLLKPLNIGGRELPAPLDDLNDGGVRRCLSSFFVFHGVRRTGGRLLQRKDVAVTPEEVETMIRKHGRYIREDDIAAFKDRICILYVGEKQKMGYRDAEHYTRVVPCNRLHEQEIRRYFNLRRLWDADPEVYIFSAKEDGSVPICGNTLFKPEFDYVRRADGEIMLDAHGKKVLRYDENGLPKFVRQPGHWYEAVHRAQEYLTMQGQDWRQMFPIHDREAVHGFRANLETTFVQCGWLQEGRRESGQDLEPPRYVDYVMNRKMSTNVRNEHYVPLEPQLLLAIVDLQLLGEAMLAYTRRKKDELNRSIASLRNVMGFIPAA
jgi:hypothetical protein